MTQHPTRKPIHEHTVPWFWPMTTAMEFEKEGLQLYLDNMRFIERPPKSRRRRLQNGRPRTGLS